MPTGTQPPNRPTARQPDNLTARPQCDRMSAVGQAQADPRSQVTMLADSGGADGFWRAYFRLLCAYFTRARVYTIKSRVEKCGLPQGGAGKFVLSGCKGENGRHIKTRFLKRS